MTQRENHFAIFGTYKGDYEAYRNASAQIVGADARERTAGRARALNTLQDHFGKDLPFDISTSEGLLDNQLAHVLDLSQTNLQSYFVKTLDSIIEDAPGKPLSETARILMYDPITKGDHASAGKFHARAHEFGSLLEGAPEELVAKTIEQFVTHQTQSIKQTLESKYPYAKDKAKQYAEAAKAVYALGFTPEKAFAYVSNQFSEAIKGFEHATERNRESYGREALLGTVKRLVGKDNNVEGAIDLVYSLTKKLPKK